MKILGPVTESNDAVTKLYADTEQTFKDFCNGPKYFYSGLLGSAGFSGLTSGTSATVLQKSNAGREGVIELNTGSTATGRAGIYRAHNMSGALMRPNQNHYIEMHGLIKIPVLSDATQEFTVSFGLIGDPTNPVGATSAHIALIYNRAVSGNFWVASTNNGTSQATTVSSIPVTTDWVWLTVKGNAANTGHSFYVNNVLIGTDPITANISNLFGLYPGVTINKTVQTTARTLEFDDYMDIQTPTVVKIA